MNDKVYPMDDDYNQALDDLLELIKVRDELVAALKFAPPETLRESQKFIAEMTEKIDECETALANQYEAHQAKYRAEETANESMRDLMDIMESTFLILKNVAPDKLEEAKARIFKGWTAEEIEEFHDRIAIREATELKEIIAEKIDQ